MFYPDFVFERGGAGRAGRELDPASDRGLYTSDSVGVDALGPGLLAET